jgi:Outer membrane protein beta-barrel domain
MLSMRKWLIFAFSLIVFSAKSQKMDLGIHVGATHYFGDLSPKELAYYPENIGSALGVFVRHHFTDHLALRSSLTYLQTRGDERFGGVLPERGLNFKADMLEAMFTLQMELFHLGRKVRLSPYAALAGGGFYFSNSTEFQGQRYFLRPLNTEGQGIEGYPKPYLPIALQFGVGGGLNILINERFNIGLEGMVHGTNTDYLDDVGTIQIKKFGDLLQYRGELTARLSEPRFEPTPENFDKTYSRGGKYKDWYIVALGSLSWRLQKGRSGGKGSKNLGCPNF